MSVLLNGSRLFPYGIPQVDTTACSNNQTSFNRRHCLFYTCIIRTNFFFLEHKNCVPVFHLLALDHSCLWFIYICHMFCQWSYVWQVNIFLPRKYLLFVCFFVLIIIAWYFVIYIHLDYLPNGQMSNRQ